MKFLKILVPTVMLAVVIDEVRIYNEALCTRAVQQLSTLGSTGTGL